MRKLTAEQQAAKEARRAKFSALWKQVANMPETERLCLVAKYGFVTCDGHTLSPCNMMLVALQCPGATVLGGFRQWIKHGRAVKKGEHGAMIWCPTGSKKDGEAQPTSEPKPEANGEAHSDHRFIIGTVFDISQTQEIETGKPEPIAEPEPAQAAPVVQEPKAQPQSIRVKTVRIEDDVRDVLLRSTIDGCRLTLPGQLDRALYTRVAKAIEAAGGKWNRKEACHIFPRDVRETLDINYTTVEVVNVKQTFQAFNTPDEVATRVAELAELTAGDHVLEPSAGTGQLARACVRAGVFWSHITAVEIDPRLASELEINGCKVICGDFLAHNGDLGTFDKIVMNPPFTRGQDVAHVQHALHMLNDGGRLVAIVANGTKQREALEPIATAWIDLGAGAFADAGTDVNTAIVVIDK